VPEQVARRRFLLGTELVEQLCSDITPDPSNFVQKKAGIKAELQKLFAAAPQ
jgi:hypothetical protein